MALLPLMMGQVEAQGDSMLEIPRIAHVTLTVTDLSRTVPWYERLFDAKFFWDDTAGSFRRVVWLVDGQTLVGFHQFLDPAETTKFDEHRLGLDHLAFACSNRAEVEQWKARLDDLGIANGGVVDAAYGSALSFRDPDNIALEFFVPSSS
jgi:glyoxylase I family protein